MSSISFRVVMIGDVAVGKTSIITSLVSRTFDENMQQTSGANYQTHTFKVGDDLVKMEIWDTAGQEKFRSLCPIYYRKATAAVAVFSLTDEDGYIGLDDWIKTYIDNAPMNPIIAVVGNKLDKVDERKVDVKTAKTWAESRGYIFYASSAKDGTNITEIFTALASAVIAREQGISLENVPPYDSQDPSKDKKESSCC